MNYSDVVDDHRFTENNAWKTQIRYFELSDEDFEMRTFLEW